MSPAQTLRVVACAALAVSLAGCGSDGFFDAEGDDEPTGSSWDALGSRWQPPQTSQTGTYADAPPWNGGRSCSGGLKPGARARGDQIRAKFGIAKVEGYACRPNTANKSQLSMHGTGRALDIMVTSTKGEKVADFIVQNANALGFQLVIWNRTLWKVTPGGGSSREYTGPNPHTDHIHAELTVAAASSTPADDGSGDPPADPAPADPPGGGAACTRDGDCNPGNDGSGQICSSGRCTPGCRSDAQCPGATRCVSGACV